MELALFLGLGLFASGWSFATLPRSLDDVTRVTAASIALFSWALIALHATNIETVTDGGTIVTSSYSGVAWLATALALIMLLFAVWRTYRTFQR